MNAAAGWKWRIRALAVCASALVALAGRSQDCAIKWHTTNSQGNVDLRSVATNGSVDVAVGDLGTILVSTEAGSWTRIPSGTRYDLRGIAWGNGQFVTVGYDSTSGLTGIILSSPDGVSWQSRGTFNVSRLCMVSYGAGLFVALAVDGSCLISRDGTNWTPVEGGIGFSPSSLIFDGNRFVAAGLAIIGSIIETSTDGRTWTHQGDPMVERVRGMAFGGGKYALIGTSNAGMNCIAFTSDLANYTICDPDPDESAYPEAICYTGSQFIAVGSIAANNTGAACFWSSQPDGSWARNSQMTARQFLAAVPDGDGVLAVGGPSFICRLGGDGTWGSELSGAEESLTSVAYGDQAGVFVAVGDFGPMHKEWGTILVSRDGITWTVQGFPYSSSGQLTQVGYADGQFVILGSDHGYQNLIVMTSRDGFQWTYTTQPMSSRPYVLGTMAYGDGTYVVPADPGGLLVSRDRTSWTLVPLPGIPLLTGVTYGGGRFVAVAGETILTSEDAVQWTPRSSSHVQSLTKVAYGNNQFVAVGFQGVVLTSPDGIDWTRHSISGGGDFSAIAYGDGTYLAAATNYAFSSKDGVHWMTQAGASENPGLVLAVTYGSGTFVGCGVTGTLFKGECEPVPPSVFGMGKLGNPFRIAVQGTGFHSGIRLEIGGTPWPDITFKNTNSLMIKGGSALREIVPKGTPETFRFVNPDGGEASVVWQW